MKLFIKSNRLGYDATCIMKDNKFIICKGAKLAPLSCNFRPAKSVINYRNNKEYVDDNLITLSDIEFNSSSTAAQFVVGQSVNGNIKWRNSEKQTLKDILKNRS